MELQWNVYRHDINKKKIVKYNIFEHGRFREDVINHLKKCETKEDFTEKLRHSLMYYFWAKCEHEVVITSWVPHISKDELDRIKAESEEFYGKHGHYPYSIYTNPEVAEKVDIYSQVMLNFDVFVDYAWRIRR